MLFFKNRFILTNTAEKLIQKRNLKEKFAQSLLKNVVSETFNQ